PHPRLLAAVRPAAARPATGETRVLYELIPVRRTSREPFSDRPVPPRVLAELRIAASREGATLVPLERDAAAEMLEYAAIAEDELAADPAYRAELAAWTMPGARFDGVPACTHGPRPARDPAPVRDFGRHERQARFEEHPQLAVLTTLGDRPLDWLRAGQALQRVLLTATRHGLSASFLNQPLDLRDLRRRRDPHHRRGHAQMIIRLGYGPHVPGSPRRPAGELETHHARRRLRRPAPRRRHRPRAPPAPRRPPRPARPGRPLIGTRGVPAFLHRRPGHRARLHGPPHQPRLPRPRPRRHPARPAGGGRRVHPLRRRQRRS